MGLATANAEIVPDPDNTVTPLRGSLRVLVVEDDAADAYLIRQALESDPRVREIVRAKDGVEALSMLENGTIHPDLAIIDLQMPRKDGFSFLVDLACQDEREFPTVVLTSSKARADAVRSRLRGARLVLTKPDTLRELETILHRAIATL